jgi:mannonate dehydratase
MDLLNLRRRIEDFGLKLEAIENVPYHFYDRVLIGAEGRDAQIENYCETLRNLGRAGWGKSTQTCSQMSRIVSK